MSVNPQHTLFEQVSRFGPAIKRAAEIINAVCYNVTLAGLQDLPHRAAEEAFLCQLVRRQEIGLDRRRRHKHLRSSMVSLFQGSSHEKIKWLNVEQI